MEAIYAGNFKTIEQIIADSAKNTSDRKLGELGKDEFLNLLITQLRYQDPLNPVDDKEFIAQMAQFSALEQMRNLNDGMSQYRAYSLLGKSVTANLVDKDSNESMLISGIVAGVRVQQGRTYVIVKGREIPVENIMEVAEGTSASSGLHAYSGYVGRKAEGGIFDPETGDIIYVNGVISSVQKGIYEDYAVMDGVRVIISGILAEEQSADPNFRIEYLESHRDRKVDVEITDQNGAFVAVRGLLRDFETDAYGTIYATLDEVYVPVDNITNLEKIAKDNISAYTGLIGYNVSGSVRGSGFSDYVAVSGTVRYVEAGQYENYVVIDGASVEIVDVVTGSSDADMDYKKNWLSENVGNTVTVVIRDGKTGKRATVTAVLNSCEFNENGDITALLDSLRVPADSITEIRP